MDTQAPYYVVSEIIPLPAPLESTLRADLQQRLNRRLAEAISFVRTPGGSIDWRCAALQAQAQLFAIRTGTAQPYPRMERTTRQAAQPAFAMSAAGPNCLLPYYAEKAA